ncbi:PAS domain-containing protein [Chitinophaga arvensicola]|uniref:histidine kinase n=1 Tax=Chitinophaga arvensicola TaxID=29529 RepID=A0A1I0Q2B1_9BACT|nr:PAS domain-containing protein [Chitinophaga arvensicola]SEW20933.1 PAS domain S-box-containing protein [Chitinophaga arvensicola]
MRNAPQKIACLLLFLAILINSYVLFQPHFHSGIISIISLLLLSGAFTLLFISTFPQNKRHLQFEHLFNEYPIPMWIYEKSTMRFLSVNNAATKKYGYSRTEFLNLTLKDIRNEEDIPLLLENAAERCNGDEYRGIWKHRKKDGSNFFVEIYSLPAVYFGKTARFIMAKDVDQQVKAAKEAHELGMRYELLAQATNDAVYDKNLVTDAVTWNHGLSHLFLYKNNNDTDLVQWWQSNIHPADYTRIMTSLETCKRTHLNYWSEEYRFRCADGSYKHVVDRAFIMYENNIPHRMIGMIQDIDKHVKQARQLEEQNKALKEIAWINSHEIRRPVVAILSITGLFDKSNQDLHLNTQLMEWLHESTLQLDDIIHKIEHKVKTLQ